MTAIHMKSTATILFVTLVLTAVAHETLAQGIATPLTIQGVDQFVDAGTVARGMGGAHIGSRQGVVSGFFDPAGLTMLDQIEIRAGALSRGGTYEQHQEWLPNRFYVEMSLILENDPAAVNKPFDSITPDWSRHDSDTRPSVIVGAVPFRVGSIRAVAGVGYATVIDLNHFFQNNNALDPNIGQMRPEPIPRVIQGDSLHVSWFRHYRDRTGSIGALTPMLALKIGEGLSLGASLSVLSGSSEDREGRFDRGLFTLRYNNDLSLAPADHVGEWSGESQYGGTYATISGRYETGYFQLGLAVRTPYTIEREWSGAGAVHPHQVGSVDEEGTDFIELPMMMSVGVSVLPTDRWVLSASLDRRGYDEVTYRTDDAGTISPWLAGEALRLGAQFQATSWLALRGGYRNAAETFAPEGTGLMDEPAGESTLSAGLGLIFGRFGIDMAYEHASTSYRDRWLSNVNHNTVTRKTFLFETFVRF